MKLSLLKGWEKLIIEKTLEEHDFNRTRTAKFLGMPIRTLRNKIHYYEIKCPVVHYWGVGPRAVRENKKSRTKDGRTE